MHVRHGAKRVIISGQSLRCMHFAHPHSDCCNACSPLAQYRRDWIRVSIPWVFVDLVDYVRNCRVRIDTFVYLSRMRKHSFSFLEARWA